MRKKGKERRMNEENSAFQKSGSFYRWLFILFHFTSIYLLVHQQRIPEFSKEKINREELYSFSDSRNHECRNIKLKFVQKKQKQIHPNEQNKTGLVYLRNIHEEYLNEKKHRRNDGKQLTNTSKMLRFRSIFNNLITVRS